MSALFVRSDLERCARIAVREVRSHPQDDGELAVLKAVGDVSGDGFVYYDEFAVKDILRHVLGRADVDEVFEHALHATRR